MITPAPYAATRAERARAVAPLRAQGLTHREIAERLGLSRSYVSELVADPDGTMLAARIARNRGACEDCGKPTFGGNGKAKAPARCDACYRASIASEHGTPSRYQAGCSCDECRRANREAHAKLKGRTPPSHGYSGYTNYACRCLVCRNAHRHYHRANGYEYQKRYAERQRNKRLADAA